MFFKGLNKKWQILSISVLVLVGFLIFTSAGFIFAQDPFGVEEAQFEGLGTQTDLKQVIRIIVNILLGFLGIVAVLIVIYAGWLWLTAAGDPGQINKAKKILTAAIIGIIIIIASWTIVAFVFRILSGEPGEPIGQRCEVIGAIQPCGPGGCGYRVCLATGFWSSCDLSACWGPSFQSQYSYITGFKDEELNWRRNLSWNFSGTVNIPASATLQVGGWAKNQDGTIEAMDLLVSENETDFSVISNFSGLPTDQSIIDTSANWDTNNYELGSVLLAKIRVTPAGGGLVTTFDSRTVRTIIRPDHCFNGIRDGDETGIDCGGSCGACAGESCGLYCSDDGCAGGICQVEDCLCAYYPVIEYISPATDPNGDTNFDDPATWDDDVPNGAPGNYITIWGRYFGESPGEVWFGDTLAKVTLIEECGDTWRDFQIVAEVPDISLGEHPVVVVNANSLSSNEKNFLINDVVRPGICAAYNLDRFNADGRMVASAIYPEEIKAIGNNFPMAINGQVVWSFKPSDLISNYADLVWGVNYVIDQAPINRRGRSSIRVYNTNSGQYSNYFNFLLSAGGLGDPCGYDTKRCELDFDTCQEGLSCDGETCVCEAIPNVCGDNILGPEEACDLVNGTVQFRLGNQCGAYGLGEGLVTCNLNNCTLNTAQCSLAPIESLPARYSIYTWAFVAGSGDGRFAAPRIIEDCSRYRDCRPGQRLPSPTPWKEWNQINYPGLGIKNAKACLDAIISARFTTRINEASLMGRVVVLECDKGCEEIEGVLSVFPDNNDFNDGFKFIPNHNLQAGHNYKVVLRRGIRSYYNVPMAVNEAVVAERQCNVAGIDDAVYCWDFETRWNVATDGPLLCPEGCPECIPDPEYFYYYGEDEEFFAHLDSEDNVCLMVNPKDKGWSWSISDPTKVSINPVLGASTVGTAQGETIPNYASLTARLPSGKSDFCRVYVDFTNPIVIEDPSCPDGTVQSPSPWLNSTDVCRNALISARFSRLMVDNTITLNTNTGGLGQINGTVIVERCNSGDVINETSCQRINLSGDLRTFQYSHRVDYESLISGATEFDGGRTLATGFVIDSNVNFAANTWYRIIILGGNNGVRGASRNNDPEGILKTPNFDFDYNDDLENDYYWIFKTTNYICDINSVNVLPAKRFMRYTDETQEYNAFPQAANCNILNRCLLDWDWRSLIALDRDESGDLIATITRRVQQSNVCGGLADGLVDPVQLAAAQAEGEVYIKAIEPGGKWGAGYLNIGYANLLVKDKWPSCQGSGHNAYVISEGICTNAEIGVEFNLDVISASVKLNENVQLWECQDDDCRAIGEVRVPLEKIYPTDQEFSKEFIFTVNPSYGKGNFLEQNTAYRLIIKGGSDGVRAWNGKELSGLNYGTGPSGEECEPNIYPWNTQPGVCSDRTCLLQGNLCGTQFAKCSKSGTDEFLVINHYSKDKFIAAGNNYAEFKEDVNKLMGAMAISVSAEVKPSGGGDTDIFLAQHRRERGYYLSLSPAGGLVVGLKTEAGGNEWYRCFGQAVNFKSGESNFVELRWDGVSRKIQGYVNGIKYCESGNVPGPLSSDDRIISNHHLYIGGSFYGNVSEYFRGEIRNVRVNTFYCSDNCNYIGNTNVASCGNGVVEPGEECDDGNTNNGDGCSSNCLWEGSNQRWGSLCGNGRVEYGEMCDDGNTNNGDGCSSNCLVEDGWVCTLNPQGLSVCYEKAGAIRLAGSIPNAPICGNGIVEIGEDCDFGGGIANTSRGCTKNCLWAGSSGGAVCGNNIVEQGQPTSYSWAFRTKRDNPNTAADESLCAIARVRVLPSLIVADGAGPVAEDYRANPYSAPDQCLPTGQRLSPIGYNWTWNINPPDFANFIINPLTSYLARANILNTATHLDTARVLATANPGSDNVVCEGDDCAELKVLCPYDYASQDDNACGIAGRQGIGLDGCCHWRPVVLSGPSGQVCPNAILEVGFDQLMDAESLNKDNIILEQRCDTRFSFNNLSNQAAPKNWLARIFNQVKRLFSWFLGNNLTVVAQNQWCPVVSLGDYSLLTDFSDFSLDTLGFISYFGDNNDNTWEIIDGVLRKKTLFSQAVTTSLGGWLNDDAEYLVISYKVKTLGHHFFNITDGDHSVGFLINSRTWGGVGQIGAAFMINRPDGTLPNTPRQEIGDVFKRHDDLEVVLYLFNNGFYAAHLKDSQGLVRRKILYNDAANGEFAKINKNNLKVSWKVWTGFNDGIYEDQLDEVGHYNLIENGYDLMIRNQNNQTILQIIPYGLYGDQLFDTSGSYRLTIKGDNSADNNFNSLRDNIREGVLSFFGVSMNGRWGGGDLWYEGDNNDKIFNFSTQATVCAIDRVEVSMSPPINTRVIDRDVFFCRGNNCGQNTPNDKYDDDVSADWNNDYRDPEDRLIYATTAGGALSGNQHYYRAQAYSGQIPIIANYQWRVEGQDLIALTGTRPASDLSTANWPQVIDNKQNILVTAMTPKSENGLTSILIEATGLSEDGSPKTIEKSIPVRIFLCENPWPSPQNFPFIDSANNCTVGSGACLNTNFELYYCRDRGQPGPADDLPALSQDVIISGVNADATILKEFLFTRADVGASRDAIGVRVIGNNNHYSPLRWYQEVFYGQPQGTIQSLVVDGYQAIREGRTIYVNAADLNDARNLIYSDIYLMSYNEGADNDTRTIYQQLINGWRFNAGVAAQGGLPNFGRCSNNQNYYCLIDVDCQGQGYCLSDKAKLTRDLKRLSDIQDINRLLNRYYNQKRCSNDHDLICDSDVDCYGGASCGNYYPDLKAGTYVANRTTSRWPSWQATLGNALGSALPVDPINQLAGCGEGSYHPQTCWSEIEKTMRWCPNNSHVYLYRAVGEPLGINRLIKVKREYLNPPDPPAAWRPIWTDIEGFGVSPFAGYNDQILTPNCP